MVERFFRDLIQNRWRRGVFHDAEELIMSNAFAVQMKGLGLWLCLSMNSPMAMRSSVPAERLFEDTGWCMLRIGWRCREYRCERRRLAGMKQIASRLPVATIFPALTPLALRAPSVSAGKTSSRRQRKPSKALTDADH